MKDEIKEILDYFRKYMCIEDCIKLSKIEDYITNLQEENETLKGSSTSTKQWLYKQNKSRLKANLKLVEERDKYKSRNEKAIERIKKIQKNAIKYGADHDASICQDLINILRGEDKDE